MKKLCENLGIRRLSVKEMCTLALLIAVTIVLSMYATLRIGSYIKVSLKFIPVFITGALFGPVPAGLVGFLGDLLNTFIQPVGPWLPQLSLIEFLFGFTFGMCFYKHTSMSPSYILRLVICVIIQFALSIFLNTLFLVQMGYVPAFTAAIDAGLTYWQSFAAAVVSRLPASLAKLVLQCVVIAVSAAYLPVFEKIIRK